MTKSADQQAGTSEEYGSASISRFVAFLRAINVGRGRTINMDSLRQLFESLGFSEVATFMVSGNVVFETTTTNAKTLEGKIERRLEEALGYVVVAFIRTDAELADIANYEPFSQSEIDTAAELNIIFLADTLDEKSKQKVMALRTDSDEFRVHGREIYWLRRPRQNESTFSNVPLEKTLGTPFTIRGARTVKKLAAKYAHR